MFFSRKRTKLDKPKSKKFSLYYLPALTILPGCKESQAEAVEHSFPLLQQHLLACHADPYYGVFLPSLDVLEPYLNLYPEERTWVKRLIQQERCSINGSMNCAFQPAIGAEAWIRNLLIGRETAKALLGEESPVYINSSNSFNECQFSQILIKSGFEAAVLKVDMRWKKPHSYPSHLPALFLWCAPDGSKIITYPFQNQGQEESILNSLEQWAKKPLGLFPLKETLYIDIQIDSPPTTELVGNCRKMLESSPSILVSGANLSQYFSIVHYSVKEQDVNLVSGEFWGGEEAGNITRIDLKIANRILENHLYEAELWSTIANLQGCGISFEKLEQSWRQAIYSHPPESIGGIGTELHYIDLLEGYRNAIENTVEQRNLALTHMAGRINTSNEEELPACIVFNSLPWRCDAVIRHWFDVTEGTTPYLMDRTGEPILYDIQDVQYTPEDTLAKVQLVWVQQELPAAGYVVLNKREESEFGMPFLQRRQGQTWLENDFFRIEVDPERGGGMTRLYDKELDKEFIQQDTKLLGNDIVLLNEQGDRASAESFCTTGKIACGSEGSAEVQYVQGDIGDRLYIRGNGPGGCKRVQEICLYHELPYIDLTTFLQKSNESSESRESSGESSQNLYMLTFPLDLPGSLPVFENHFYAKAGWRTPHPFQYQSFTNESFQSIEQESGNLNSEKSGLGHGLQHGYRWVDVSWAFLVHFMENETKIGSLAFGPSDIVTGSGAYRDIRNRFMLFLSRQGSTCTPRTDQERIALQPNHINYVFAIGSREENQYTHRLLEQNKEALEYYERSLEQLGSVIMLVSDRVSSSFEHIVMILAGKTPAYTRQAIEELMDNTVRHQWECSHSACFLSSATPIVENVGLAILNKGTLLGGVEADGNLTIPLLRTAPYPVQQTPWPYDFAENRSHVFQHRLIPHSGDWRKAEIPRRAMEYNHAPIVVNESAHKGAMPSKYSFFSVGPNNVLISALKPADYPFSTSTTQRKASSSAVMRVYESHGEESNLLLDSGVSIKNIRSVQIDETPVVSKRKLVQEESQIRSTAYPFEIINFMFDGKPEFSPPTNEPDTKPEEIPEIVFSRFWRYNQGAPSNGGMPISVLFRGGLRNPSDAPDLVIQNLDLVLVNHTLNTTHEGTVELTTRDGWRTIPNQVKYRLQGGGFQIVSIQVLFDQPFLDGFVKASTRIENRLIEDIVQIGSPLELGLEMALTRDSFQVFLQHQYSYPLSGYVSLITPPQAWPEDLVGNYSISCLEKSRCDFNIKTGEQVTLEFGFIEIQNRFAVSSDHIWMIVKIALHNSVRYYHVRLDEYQSEGLGRVLAPPYDRSMVGE